MPKRFLHSIIVLSIVGAAGCETERTNLGAPVCVAWKSTVGPLLSATCGDCHRAQAAAGGVVLDDYVAAVPLTRPRDGSAPLLAVFDADDTHRPLAATAQSTLRQWIVDCDAAFVASSIHPAGIMDPSASADFHAALLRASGYDFEDCQRCHGTDFAGGGANASCLTCHPAGPTDCSTCHENELRSGAHDAHAATNAPLQKATACATCHRVPEDALAPGHFRLARGELDPAPAEVVLSGPAAWGPPTTAEPAPTVEPVYDRATGTCVNVYCHGGAGDDDDADRTTPRWTDPTDVDCTSCHGAPPADHPGARCGDCHGAVSAGPAQLTDFDLHLDGRLQFSSDPADCGDCHGGADGAPGPDLDGLVTRTATTVGAHRPHLEASLRLAAPVECSECHLVPDAVTDAGHIDSDRPAEVFVAGSGAIARADNASPIWERARASCRNTYCHGGGTRLSADISESKLGEVRWTSSARQQVYCGSCHGVPPTLFPHVEGMGLTDCVDCHAQTVDGFGNITFDGNDTAHINGVADFNLGSGS